MNVFHWHIVDSQSFPFQSASIKNLSRGAFSSNHIYTIDEITDLVEFARLRGVRIIPEFDTPSHTLSLREAGDNIVINCEKPGGTLDITNDKNVELIETLFKELKSIFKDEYLHIGGDEVRRKCWTENDKVKAWMKEHHLKDEDLESYWMGRVQNISTALGYKTMVWEETFRNKVPLKPGTIVQVWKDFGEFKAALTVLNAAKEGYNVILSSPWYYDWHQYDKEKPEWQRAWDVNMLDDWLSSKDKHHMLGGEGCMWTEFVDSANIYSRMFPKLLATAERLWSNPKKSQEQEALIGWLNNISGKKLSRLYFKKFIKLVVYQ